MEAKKKNFQIRGQRGSKRQKEILIKYMEDNINFAHDRIEGEYGVQKQQLTWDKLTTMLNATDDAQKTAEQWKQYWRDLRRNVKAKAASRCHLDQQEKRIYSLIIPDGTDLDEEIKPIVELTFNALEDNYSPVFRERVPFPDVNVDDSESQEIYRELDVSESNDGNMEQLTGSETPFKKIKMNHEYDDVSLKSTHSKTTMTIPLVPEPDDEISIFGKFIVSELRGIIAASNQIVYRQAKRKIQQILLNTWDDIDNVSRSSTRSSFASDSSFWTNQIVNDSLNEDESNVTNS